MMFVHPSICLSGTGVHCDHTAHAIAQIYVYGWIVQCFGHQLGVTSQERLKMEDKLLLSAN